MEKNNNETSQDEIFDLFMKWKGTPKNQQTSLATTLKEKISETIPSSYGIKIEECNMRCFVLLTDSDFFKCNTPPFTCVYEFCQYLETYHQKEDDWYDTLLPHCIPGSDRQQWVAYNIYRFKFTWKQVCFRLMQKYDSPSRRTELEKTLRETKFDSGQSIQKFNEKFNACIDELFYDEHTAIEVYITMIPNEYASMLSTTIIIDESTSFIYTLADVQQRAADIINASDKDIICYINSSHTIYSTESETSVCCQDQHSITNCPDTFVLRWSKKDPRNKKNEVEKPLEHISFLPKASKSKKEATSSVMTPAVPSSILSPLKIPSESTPSGSKFKSSSPSQAALPPRTNSSNLSIASSSSFPVPQPLKPNARQIIKQKRYPPKRKVNPQSKIGDKLPPQVKKSKKIVKCRNCGANYSYGHNNVCSKRGGRIISRNMHS